MPIRPRRHLLLAAVAVLAAAPWDAVSAQVGRDTARVTRDSARARPAPTRQAVPDSLQPPLSPGRAFLQSVFLPGLGQSRLKRPFPGAIYAGVEALSIVMLLKAQNDLRIARQHVDDAIVDRWRVDQATGAPILDDDGKPIPLDSVANPFSADLVSARRSQVEDWIAVIIANHLFAGADAFVASLLWDLPARVGVQRLRNGYGVGLSVRW